MLRDPTALLNIQVAFMGIVLVVGLFYLWRMMKGVESKVRKLSDVVAKLQEQLEVSGVPATNAAGMSEEDAVAQAFMNEVFNGGNAPPMFLHPFPTAPTSSVVIEEAAPAEEDKKPAPVADDDSVSVATTSALSKSKVRKMTGEALREICKERGLDTEGTRAILMERVLATLDD